MLHCAPERRSCHARVGVRPQDAIAQPGDAGGEQGEGERAEEKQRQGDAARRGRIERGDAVPRRGDALPDRRIACGAGGS
jgi:hypothetical protein